MLIGHRKQWHFLKKSFELGRIPHGLLFQGQEKLGKRTFALEFIKLVNCKNNELTARPCQKCLSCQEIGKAHCSHIGAHPDFVLVEPFKKEIRISQIRDLSLKLASKPSLASFKSAIIDQAHFMTREAQSCFLKTLEEPKGKTILILITEYPERLLPTILSRVQRIKFYPVKKEEIKNYLISQGLLGGRAEELTDISSGRPGVALDFLSAPTKLEDRREKISDLVRICNSPLSFRFQCLKDLSLESSNLKETLEVWLTYFRSALITKINNQQPTINQSRYPLSKLKKILQLIEDTIFYISTTNVNPRLALETLILELDYDPPTKEGSSRLAGSSRLPTL